MLQRPAEFLVDHSFGYAEAFGEFRMRRPVDAHGDHDRALTRRQCLEGTPERSQFRACLDLAFGIDDRIGKMVQRFYFRIIQAAAAGPPLVAGDVESDAKNVVAGPMNDGGVARSVQTQIGLMQNLACKLLRTKTAG